VAAVFPSEQLMQVTVGNRKTLPHLSDKFNRGSSSSSRWPGLERPPVGVLRLPPPRVY
jgi:hypothetical protein